MHRKWKKVSALGLAVLLGCLMPMSTMLAAEDDTEVVRDIEADSDSDADVASDAETITDDDESIGDEVDTDDESAGDEVDADDENTGDEADADNDGNEGIEVMSETEEPEAGDIEVQENTAAPVIDITLNGDSCKVDGLSGDIDYKYTNSSDPMLAWSASQNGTEIMLYYYLDDNPGDKAKDDIAWSEKCSSMQWTLSSNKTYVLYVKAVGADGQTTYARSCGIVVDTVAPKIVGVEDGNTYPAGTTFTVEDANLDVVMVNESPVTPEADGSYQVKANGTNCMIRAKDKAGNEKTCSITVLGEEPTENTVISASGTYSLKTGTSYQLATGKWQVGGDSTVYQGGRTFYVKSAGDYSFTKQ